MNDASEPISLRTRPVGAHEIAPPHPPAAIGRGRAEPARQHSSSHRRYLPLAYATTFGDANPIADPGNLAVGVPYCPARHLLAHELGHYVLARVHGVDATLPFFIPAPPLFFIGTLGAFIRMRSLPRDRKALFDVGAAGPWAGIAVAVPLLIVELALSEVKPLAPNPGGAFSSASRRP
ncbi:MAG: site-2 protease family protein [Candidatus Binatia bacterium]